MRDVTRPSKLSSFIAASISPIFAAIAIYSLFIPWVSGKLLVIGKTITAKDFPNVFWSVIIGGLAIIGVYIHSLFSGEIVKRRVVVFILSVMTLLSSGYFLYLYSKTPSIPGVRVSFRGGLLVCFISLILAVAGSVIPFLKTIGLTQTNCNDRQINGQPEIAVTAKKAKTEN